VPVRRRIDGDDRLAEPHLGRRSQTHHAEVGADLYDRIHIASAAIELDQLPRSTSVSALRDRGPALAFR
jgi:hypothetical protein